MLLTLLTASSLLVSLSVVCHCSCQEIKSFCIIYLVDVKEVPDFNTMYELYDPVTGKGTCSSRHVPMQVSYCLAMFPNSGKAQDILLGLSMR